MSQIFKISVTGIFPNDPGHKRNSTIKISNHDDPQFSLDGP